MWGIIWTPNRNSCSSNSSRKIGTSLDGSLLTCLEFLGSLIEHELHLDLKAKPAKQRLRCFAQDKKCNKERLLDC
jgi:hypothetical protein